MDSAISLSVTPLQAILAIAFQAWLIFFPIMLMRKIDRLTERLEEHLGDAEPEETQGENQDQ